jgi:hypothetical protein
MKSLIVLIAMLGVALACGAAAILTSDPLTRLPLDPATNSRLNLGNAPTAMQPSKVCKSDMQANFYNVYESINEANAWYKTHLKDFKHVHGYSNNRSRDAYYNSSGTVVVGVTGEPGKERENVDTHAVVYYTFQPGLSEKTILAMVSENVVC